MHIKTGDTVKILVGKDRGKTGKVISVDPKKNRAVVEGLNIYYRHQRPRQTGQKGQKIQVPMPVRASNLMLIDPHTKKPSRVKYRINEKGLKERVAKKSDKPV